MNIGSKIKDLRVQKGLTQEELANRTELSKSFISQLERDLTSPSIATLYDILQCLGTNLADFFNETREEQIVFSRADYFEKQDQELNNSIQWIIPNAQKWKTGKSKSLRCTKIHEKLIKSATNFSCGILSVLLQ